MESGNSVAPIGPSNWEGLERTASVPASGDRPLRWAVVNVRGRLATWTLTGLAGVALIFEQSPANEELRTKIGLDVLESTSSALAVGAIIFAVTFVIEIVSTLLIAVGLAYNPSLRHWIRRRFPSNASGPSGQHQTRLSVADVGVSLGMGAGLVVAMRHVADPDRRVRADLVLGIAASSAVALVSAIIGWLAAGGIQHADAVGLGTPARWFVDWATDWRFWGVVVTVYYAARWVRGASTRHRRVEEPEPSAAGSATPVQART